MVPHTMLRSQACTSCPQPATSTTRSLESARNAWLSSSRNCYETTAERAQTIFAWIVLPNHYHVLVDSGDILALLKVHGHLHGRTSFRWNGEDARRGRQVWHRAAETAMKSERHFWATLNYVLHNAVRHGYVERWQDWPYSNAAEYLEDVGRDLAEWRWREYPILEYGNNWDPPEL